ncbi:MAG: putative ABC transporter permease [Bacilli bacterium]|jgi:uncharacterized membrane protein|nr:putative ABC transporter permease [Bacilli bacterium]
MDFFFRYSFLFFLGGMAGWVIELFFRRFVSQRKWVNPGFLTGPLLPLYGFGLAALYLFSNMIPWESFIPSGVGATATEILCIGIAMTLIEYLAGLIFIKGLKVKLWDYSDRWGNVQGIICPLFSLIWLSVGALYVLTLNPAFVAMTDFVMDNLIAFATAEGVCYGVLFVDLGYNLGVYAKIRQAVANRKLVVDWDKIKVSIQDHFKRIRRHANWIFPFSQRMEDFNQLMREYLAVLKLDNETRVADKRRKKDLRAEKKDEKGGPEGPKGK